MRLVKIILVSFFKYHITTTTFHFSHICNLNLSLSILLNRCNFFLSSCPCTTECRSLPLLSRSSLSRVVWNEFFESLLSIALGSHNISFCVKKWKSLVARKYIYTFVLAVVVCNYSHTGFYSWFIEHNIIPKLGWCKWILLIWSASAQTWHDTWRIWELLSQTSEPC